MRFTIYAPVYHDVVTLPGPVMKKPGRRHLPPGYFISGPLKLDVRLRLVWEINLDVRSLWFHPLTNGESQFLELYIFDRSG